MVDRTGTVLARYPEGEHWIGKTLPDAPLVLAATGSFGEWFIVRPAQALVEATKRLASGDLSVRAGGRYPRGELGQLAQAFDEMAASLERSLAERPTRPGRRLP